MLKTRLYTAPDGSLTPITVCKPSRRKAASSIQSRKPRRELPARGAKFLAAERAERLSFAAKVVAETGEAVFLATSGGTRFQFTPDKEDC